MCRCSTVCRLPQSINEPHKGSRRIILGIEVIWRESKPIRKNGEKANILLALRGRKSNLLRLCVLPHYGRQQKRPAQSTDDDQADRDLQPRDTRELIAL